MTYSLNETAALCKRAAKGAGIPWGLAEEAAMAVPGLCALGLQGAERFADLLEQYDRTPMIDGSPTSLSAPVWRAPSGHLNPLIAGASLSDCAARLQQSHGITMEHVSFPLLILPFAGGAAFQIGMPICVEWDGMRLITDGRNLSRNAADVAALNASAAKRVVITAVSDMADGTSPIMRATIPETTWVRLNVFAHRTYAPATEESRLKGAGAGTTNDD